MQSISFGKYRLNERIYTGKTTEIFSSIRVDVSDIERLVAIKRLLPSLAEDERAISDLNDEARVAVQLTHGSIAQVLDAGAIDNLPYLALEYVDGKDLKAIFERSRELKMPLSVPLSCYTIIKLCEGLNYVHEKKNPSGAPLELVHQDVCLGNVLVSYDGEIKLVDFGRAARGKKKREGSEGTPVGTYGYMSPEQVDNGELDHRSDVFCVGICLYELLTNHRLFSDRGDFAALQQIRDVDILPPSNANREITDELDRIVVKALARNPRDRFQTALELHDSLQAFMYKSGLLHGRKEIAATMGELFGGEIEDAFSGGPHSSPMNKPMPDDEGTGLFAFENLEPVSTVSALVPVEAFQRPAGPASAPQMGQHADLQGYHRQPSTPPVVAQQAAPSTQTPALRYKATLLGIPPSRSPSSRPPQFPPSYPPNAAAAAAAQRVPTPAPVSEPTSSPSQSLAGSRASTPRLQAAPDVSKTGEAFPAGALLPRPGDFDDEKTGLWVSPSAKDGEDDDRPGSTARFAAEAAAAASSKAESGSRFKPMTGDGTQPDTDARGSIARLPDLIRSNRAVVAAAAVALVLILAVFLFRGPSTGSVQLATTPEDTVVKIDGEPIHDNASPFEITEVDANTSHLIEVSKAGFVSWSTSVTINPGQQLELPPVTLDPLKVETGFSLNSVPAGVAVFVDGKQLAQVTPVRITDLKPGPHEIRLVKGPEYEPWSTRLEVPANQVVDLQEVSLVARAAESTEPVAEPEETKPEPEPKQASSGRRSSSRSARASSSSRPRKRSTAPATAAATTPGGMGVLRINTRPWSQVYVDDRLVGNTPQMGIQLPSGKHRVTLVNSDFGIRKTIRVNVRSGQTVTKVLTLTPGG